MSTQFRAILRSVVTARNNATGKTFTFTVNDKAQLHRLKVGQSFTAEQRAQWFQRQGQLQEHFSQHSHR